ncbi:hypothetical protein X798_05246 [Onchocerca flexuosa]|uniref:RRM domain-containing protein n=1 Tax=Onchocerca flexuosa TaxID=387005 RepID=A0A238BSC9_9BILA|nr:hypothetical protein X798_05246 [Onchocerca flexuosa]
MQHAQFFGMHWQFVAFIASLYISRSRSRTRSKTRSRSKTYSPDRGEEGRLHVANIDESVRARDLEEAFSRFGKLSEVWVASYPPLFAFVVFKNKSDANEALAGLNNTYIRNCRVRVSVALPRVRAHDRYHMGGTAAVDMGTMDVMVDMVEIEIDGY